VNALAKWFAVTSARLQGVKARDVLRRLTFGRENAWPRRRARPSSNALRRQATLRCAPYPVLRAGDKAFPYRGKLIRQSCRAFRLAAATYAEFGARRHYNGVFILWSVSNTRAEGKRRGKEVRGHDGDGSHKDKHRTQGDDASRYEICIAYRTRRKLDNPRLLRLLEGLGEPGLWPDDHVGRLPYLAWCDTTNSTMRRAY
jgi:hypothetical protein